MVGRMNLALKQNSNDVGIATDAALDVFEPPAQLTIISPDDPLPTVARNPDAAPPDYELFHYTISLCSQKARATLAATGCRYGSNDLIIMENWYHYRPEYLRLRLLSEAAQAGRFVSGYSGVSSAETEGFDPLVVPTFVDRKAGRVIADSKQICLYVARENRETADMLPSDLEADVIAQMDIVDRTPHVALLYGANPDGEVRPEAHQKRFPGIHGRKIAALTAQLEAVGDDPALRAAYLAKITKEQTASAFVIDTGAMRAAIAKARDIIAGLEARLAASGGPWCLGARCTLADLVWGVSLMRLKVLGYHRLWRDGGHARVADYAERLTQVPSLRSAVLDWNAGPFS